MRTHLFAAAALVATLSLSSCASPGYDQDTSQGLREHIVAISAASAAGDWQGALDGLEVMAAELSAARKAGKVDQERFDTITLAMERVRLLQNQDSGGGDVPADDKKDEGDKKDEEKKGDEKNDEGKGNSEGRGKD
ncbi:MAG: hypothetical protein K0S05_2953 [Agromyces sp.]|nr:hypothetical protein [Agromyces sp.]